MADSFYYGCYDPKKASPDQLYPLLYKTSAAAEITLCQLHFYGTKAAAQNGRSVKCISEMFRAPEGRVAEGAGLKPRVIVAKKKIPLTISDERVSFSHLNLMTMGHRPFFNLPYSAVLSRRSRRDRSKSSNRSVVVSRRGFEPPTPALGERCSVP